jgi:hypothetical protein
MTNHHRPLRCAVALAACLALAPLHPASAAPGDPAVDGQVLLKLRSTEALEACWPGTR